MRAVAVRLVGRLSAAACDDAVADFVRLPVFAPHGNAAAYPQTAAGADRNVFDQAETRFEPEFVGFHRLFVPCHETAAGTHRSFADGQPLLRVVVKRRGLIAVDADQRRLVGIVRLLGERPCVAMRVAEACEDAVFFVVRHLKRAAVDHFGIVEQRIPLRRESRIPAGFFMAAVTVGLAAGGSAAA